MKSILLIDDDKSIVQNIAFALKTKKISTLSAHDGKTGLSLNKAEQPEAIFLDYKLPDTDGLELIPKLLKDNPQTIIIMITGSATLDVAIKAIKLGAYDFMEKPFDIEKIFALINKADKEKITQEKVQYLDKHIRKVQDNFIGNDPAINAIKNTVKKVVAVPNFTILITGESGTGKEVLVRYIHENSLYAQKPLVAVNCSAIPDNLLESELFGYEKGAFTDAQNTKRGLFEIANNGIIFLDEIGDMKPELQTKLLRVLENKELRRIGGEETIKLDISVITATNKDLSKMILEGKFREDLFYRLNIIPLHLTPLRDRKDDLEPLIDYFIDKLNIHFRKNISGITAAAKEILLSYSYPGNIRELRNIIERAMILESSNTLTADNLLYCKNNTSGETGGAAQSFELDYHKYQKEVMEKIEKNYFEKLLEKYNGSVSKAAEHAGIMVPSLSRILKRLGIEKNIYK